MPVYTSYDHAMVALQSHKANALTAKAAGKPGLYNSERALWLDALKQAQTFAKIDRAISNANLDYIGASDAIVAAPGKVFNFAKEWLLIGLIGAGALLYAINKK